MLNYSVPCSFSVLILPDWWILGDESGILYFIDDPNDGFIYIMEPNSARNGALGEYKMFAATVKERTTDV